jgi:uncharacterized protein (TIGR00369 family)
MSTEQPARTLAQAQQLVEAVMKLPGLPSANGFSIVTVELGFVALAVAPQPNLLQFHGALHGGAIAALADQAAGAAVSTTLPSDQIAVTVELKLNYLAPAKGERIVAEARAVPGGKSIGVAEIKVFAERGDQRNLAAIGLATMRSVPFRLP